MRWTFFILFLCIGCSNAAVRPGPGKITKVWDEWTLTDQGAAFTVNVEVKW